MSDRKFGQGHQNEPYTEVDARIEDANFAKHTRGSLAKMSIKHIPKPKAEDLAKMSAKLEVHPRFDPA